MFVLMIQKKVLISTWPHQSIIFSYAPVFKKYDKLITLLLLNCLFDNIYLPVAVIDDASIHSLGDALLAEK